MSSLGSPQLEKSQHSSEGLTQTEINKIKRKEKKKGICGQDLTLILLSQECFTSAFLLTHLTMVCYSKWIKKKVLIHIGEFSL